MSLTIKGNIVKNISWRIVAVVISRLMAFLSIPLITISLGAEGYGRYSFYLNLITYLALPINLGFLAYGTREVARSKNSNIILSNILNIKIFLAVAIFVLFTSVSLIVSKIDVLVLIVFLMLLADAFKIDYFFYGKKNVVVPTIATFSGQSVFVSLVAILYLYHVKEFILYILAFAIYKLIENFLPWIIYLRKNVFPKIGMQLLKRNVAIKIYSVGLINKIFFFITTLPILIFPLFAEYSMLGKYSAIIKFFTLTFLVYNTLLFPIAPYIVIKPTDTLHDVKRKNMLISKIFIVTIGIGIVESLLFYFFGNFVLSVFGADFLASDLTIILVSIGLLLWTLNIFFIVIISYRDRELSVIRQLLVGVLAFLLCSMFVLLRLPLEGIFGLFIIVNVYLMIVVVKPVIEIINNK